MIEGIGIDIVDVSRFAQSLERTPLLREKLFTSAEQEKSLNSLAARFAAKEALFKALNPGRGLQWHETEIINHPSGKPDFIFRGATAELVDGAQVHLSLSHDAGVATAMVVIER